MSSLASVVLLVCIAHVLSAHIPSNGCESFEAWSARFNRQYISEVAEMEARESFKANCERYALLNQIPQSAKFVADEHADLSPEKFAQKFGGCYHEERLQSRNAPRAMSEGYESPTIDWREHGQVTPVKNQGAYGTCWSFGVAQNLEGLNVRQGHALTNISEQEFISCCTTCQGRAADASFTWLVNNTGGVPALEASWPYVGKPEQCLDKTAPKADVVLHSWGRAVDDGTGMPVAKALVAKGPMGMGVDARCFQGYHSGVIRNCTSQGVDHAVLMVAAGVDAGVNYFTIKNSWGSKWGEHGFVRIEQGHEWWGPISAIYTH